MEVPIQLVAIAFGTILAGLSWIIRAIYRLAARVQRVETVLETKGHALPAIPEV